MRKNEDMMPPNDEIELLITDLKKRTTSSGQTVSPAPFKADEFTKLIEEVRRDGGTGTWTPAPALQAVTGVSPGEIEDNFGVRSDSASADDGRVKLRFPVKNFDFDHGGIPHLLGTIAGDILGYPDIASAKVEELKLPQSVLSRFPGPNCGIAGVREITQVHNRPLIAFTVKPRLGLAPNTYAKWCVQAALGGADIVEDDERLVNPPGCPIEARAKSVLAAFKEHGVEETVYSVNITGNCSRVLELAKRLADIGVKMFKLDVLPAGFSTLQALTEYLRKNGHCIPITVYPAMGFLFSAISRSVLLQLTRLCGGDIIYAGTPALGRELGRHDVNRGDLIESVDKTRRNWQVLKDPLGTAKLSLPTVTTNIHPGNIGLLYYIAQNEGWPHPKDFAYFIGGGISFHPKGPKNGAEMCKKALDLAMKNKFSQADFPGAHQKVFENGPLDFFSVSEYLKHKTSSKKTK